VAWQFAGSFAAVLFLIGLAWRFGFRGKPQLEDEGRARSLAQAVSGGFDAVAVALDRSGHAALLRDAAGRIVLVAPSGAHFVARVLPAGTTVTREGELLGVSVQGGSVSLDLGQAADDWANTITALH
jgi:hypothetical protein